LEFIKMKSRFPIAGAEHIMGATIEREPRKYRIRRCHGNQNCWCLIVLTKAGTENHIAGASITGYSVDHLLQTPWHWKPVPGDLIEILP
jgi:hypothetical protein